MDKRFLDKVVDQIVSETRIDYNELSPTLYTPFPYPPHLIPPSSLYSSFTNHCRDVYGLNDDEVRYVWDEYIKIIRDKIKSNG